MLIVAGAVYVCWTGVTIVGAAANEGATWEGVGLAVLLFWMPQLPLLLYAFRSRVEVSADRLRVVTMFGDRSLPWHEVVDAEPGYYGMTLRLANGDRIHSGAVQKDNLSTMLRKRTRADVLADLIRERSAGSRT